MTIPGFPLTNVAITS